MAYSDNDLKALKPDKTRHDWFYYSTVYGVDGDHNTPYMTRIAIKRLRFHIFHRGDQDPDCHDHPWGFFTFPFVSYVEEVLNHVNGKTFLRTVKAFRLHYRPATYAHRVLYSLHMKRGGKCWGYNEGYRYANSKKIYTMVWAEGISRQWGFWKRREGKSCWQYWKDYIFHGGKSAPCATDYVRSGEIANTFGDLTLRDGALLKKGIAMITPEQAERARVHGWRKVRPDASGALVEVYRK
jgi:hypothetical protein